METNTLNVDSIIDENKRQLLDQMRTKAISLAENVNNPMKFKSYTDAGTNGKIISFTIRTNYENEDERKQIESELKQFLSECRVVVTRMRFVSDFIQISMTIDSFLPEMIQEA